MRRPPPTSFPTLFSGNSVWTRRLRNPKTEKIPLFRVNRGIFSCVGETGFEPATSNSRSWRANRTALHPERKRCFLSVGVTGFEPVTPCSQSRCANRTALHPVNLLPCPPRPGIAAAVPSARPAAQVRGRRLRFRSAKITAFFRKANFWPENGPHPAKTAAPSKPPPCISLHSAARGALPDPIATLPRRPAPARARNPLRGQACRPQTRAAGPCRCSAARRR